MKLHRKTIVLDDGFRVGVTEVGHGTPMVFLHGLTVSSRAYEELLVELAGHGFAVTALDAPDHGRSDSLPWGHTVEDMVDITARSMVALDLPPALIVGHSMGGGMAVEFAARWPELATAVILLDAAAGVEHHENIRVAPSPTIPFRVAKKFGGAFVDVLGDGYRAYRERSAEENLGLADGLRQSLTGFRCVRAVNALLKADTPPLLAKLREHEIPTAVIHGELDNIVPFAAGASAAQAAGAQLYQIEGGFHSWMLTDPQMAAQSISFVFIELMGVR